MTCLSIQRVGLIGWPVEHSISPAMHQAAFDSLGLPWRYVLLATLPGELHLALNRLLEHGFRGANITLPYKQAVIPYLDQIGEDARAIGAVNTIITQDGRLIGHNTDAAGFLAALSDAGFEPAGQLALVLGAGGAARAAAYALARANCSVVVRSRTTCRAVELVRDMRDVSAGVSITWTSTDGTLDRLDLASFALLVNATPIGMWPHTLDSPWPETLPIPCHWTVFDLVYNPEDTRLLAQARAAGAVAVRGLSMLLHQGAQSFQVWTGQLPPIEAMRCAARQALECWS